MQCCRACPGVLKSLRLRLSTQNVFFSFKRLRAEKSQNYKLRLQTKRLAPQHWKVALQRTFQRTIRIMTFKGTYVSSEQRIRIPLAAWIRSCIHFDAWIPDCINLLPSGSGPGPICGSQSRSENESGSMRNRIYCAKAMIIKMTNSKWIQQVEKK